MPKDDTNSTSPSEDTVSAVGAAEAGHAEPQTEQTPPAAQQPSQEGDARPARRNAPRLRVVSDNDPEFSAPAAPEEEPEAEAAPAPDMPHQRIGAAIRTARENAGFTLEQVSKETKVHVSHLRAIEEMTPGRLGAPVYAKGYIKAYARFLGMDEQTTLERFLAECAILKDPEKQDIAPPATTRTRKLPVAIPMLGILLVALAGAGIAFLLMNGSQQPAVAGGADGSEAATIATPAEGGPSVPASALAQQLRIVAVKRGHLTVRSSKGDKYSDKDYVPGEFFVVRVGLGFTVTADDGTAFEWRLGEQSLGLLQPEGGQVFSQSADLAAQRPPVVAAPPPVDPAAAPPPAGATTSATPPAGAPATGSVTAPPRPPRTTTTTPPAATPPASTATPPPAATQPQTPPPVTQPAPPARDPALAAYPDQ